MGGYLYSLIRKLSLVRPSTSAIVMIEGDVTNEGDSHEIAWKNRSVIRPSNDVSGR